MHYWPYVRRGAERLMHETSQYLAKAGHDVTVLTTKRGSGDKTAEGAVSVNYRRRVGPWLWRRQGFGSALPLMADLARGRYDIVQSYYPGYALAAVTYGRLRDSALKQVLYMVGLWPDSFLMRRALAGVSAVVNPSEWMRRLTIERFGLDSTVIQPGLAYAEYQVRVAKDPASPKILCAASLVGKASAVRLLIEAFARLSEAVPTARLQLSGDTNDAVNKALLNGIEPRVAANIEILGAGAVEDLPALYAGAAVTVQPAEGESFGMVLAESLASGTPVVAPRSGAVPEMLTRPELGVMYETRAERPECVRALSEAITVALELATDPGTECICRQHAKQYDWEVIGPKYEELYRTIGAAAS